MSNSVGGIISVPTSYKHAWSRAQGFQVVANFPKNGLKLGGRNHDSVSVSHCKNEEKGLKKTREVAFVEAQFHRTIAAKRQKTNRGGRDGGGARSTGSVSGVVFDPLTSSDEN
jgi:hypothetical protein